MLKKIKKTSFSEESVLLVENLWQSVKTLYRSEREHSAIVDAIQLFLSRTLQEKKNVFDCQIF